jgi:hypothetical protein
MRRLLLICVGSFAFGALGLIAAPDASATPIGPACGTCQGSIYEIAYDGVPVATTATTETWRITYTIDTSGYDGGGTRLDTVALKVSAQLVDADLVAAPGGVGLWNEFLGGLNAGGCSGSGSGFDCVEATSIGTSPVVPGGVYTWVFDLEIANGGLFTVDDSSVKARYVDEAGDKVGDLVSESIMLTLVPEPGTALLVAAGASLLAARRTRSRSR